ncbi:ABC transporter permease [Pararhizobium sp. BT-229]|uniref:ABC transporter permease n=1 Tax=Pararhizobium sp. BT-229 TaxID=2986923 RepID=UPI0021F76C70|nr:ABC transporter permease [Pararhizobium sp. BT-229]MCV9963260.1 ABC transporter permease [Pararhizobium sp. BT-229]
MSINSETMKPVTSLERTSAMDAVFARFFRGKGTRRLRTFAPLIGLVVLCILITIANPNFIELRNLVRVANSAAVPLTLAMGMTFIILMGSIDLSVEGALSIAAMVLVLLATNDANGNDYGWLAVVAAIAASTTMGLLNGVIQTVLRIPSFMATLGIWFIGLGISVFMLGGSAVRLMDNSIRSLALERFLGLPLAVWVAAAAFLLAIVIQYHTRLGRHILAVGGGEDVAELSGVNLKRVRITAFGVAGFFFGVAGVLAAAQLGQSNAVIADGRLFAAVTAVVVGGTALTGGEGGVLNTLVGVLIVTVLANGMVLLGISPYVQQTVQGLMIIAAVALSLDRLRLKIVK